MAHWTYDPKNKTIDAFVRSDNSYEPIALVTDERSVKQMLVTAELGEKVEFIADRFTAIEYQAVATGKEMTDADYFSEFKNLLIELRESVRECINQTNGQRKTSEIACPLTPEDEEEEDES